MAISEQSETVSHSLPIDSRSTLLLVTGDDDPSPLERALREDDSFDVDAVRSVPAALERLEMGDIDCVVGDATLGTRDGLEGIAAIRERDATLPVVVSSEELPAELVERLSEDMWTDYQRTDGPSSATLLGRRVHRLVDHRRLAALARRMLAGVETSHDGIAIVDPDGTVSFANRQYATRFGTNRETIIGDHWSRQYPPETVERLETTAIPAAKDGWRWTGSCAGLTTGGETFIAQVSLVGVDDGSLVFVI